MKKFLLASLLLISTLFTSAQNGGWYSENNSLRLEYGGNIGGVYYTNIVNKKAAPITVKVDYKGQFTEITIPANGVHAWNLGSTLTSFLIRAKNTHCGGNDCGWVELCLTNLPLKFKQFVCIPVSANEFLINFSIEQMENVANIEIQLSVDGGATYRHITLVAATDVILNKNYSVRIKINK